MSHPFIKKGYEMLTDFIADESGFFSFPVCHWGGAVSVTNYVLSVQHVSITIGALATSNTATINAVGANAFILFSGNSASTGNIYGDSWCDIALTNSTTVTATRNLLAGSCVVKGVVIDPATPLIQSVQTGTIAITATNTSNTASISAVTNNNAVVHLLGITTDDASTSLISDQATVSLSGTTVTATRNSSVTNIVVRYEVIEFKSGVLAQPVQNFSVAWVNAATTTTQAITSVNTNNALIIGAGLNTGTSSVADFQRLDLTNGTTVTITTSNANSANLVANFSVLEFAGGVLKSSVQRGDITVNAATSNTATINSVDTTKALVNFDYFSGGSTIGTIDRALCNAALTNGTTVTISKNTSTGIIIGSFEVAEFN